MNLELFTTTQILATCLVYLVITASLIVQSIYGKNEKHYKMLLAAHIVTLVSIYAGLSFDLPLFTQVALIASLFIGLIALAPIIYAVMKVFD